MKQIDIITLFPEMLEGIFNFGVLKQSQNKNILNIKYHNPRNFTEDRHKTVDDRPYGGGEGMVLMPEPLQKTLVSITKCEKSRVIYLSPQGRRLTHEVAEELSHHDQLILISGRYEGIDERFLSKYVQEEISVGDYVLSGGELPCALLVDSVSRFYPGVLGNSLSAANDSFSKGLLKYPQFTRPEVFEGLSVPKILLSGNHKLIEKWRYHIAFLRTHLRRPDLLETRVHDEIYQRDLNEAVRFLEGLAPEEKYVLGLPLE